MDKQLILALTLENAIKFNGKASSNSVIGILIAIDPKVKDQIGEIYRNVNETVAEVNSLTLDEQRARFENLKELIKHEDKPEKTGLPELSKVHKKVFFRFAPYPSGPLHVGNAKQLILNDEYAKKYHGTLILVYDDTIGSKSKNLSKEAYELISDGIKWLGSRISKVYYKSDRLNIYYEYALELIKKDFAYVCFCNPKELRKNRFNGVKCIHRDHSIIHNINYWKQMLAKKFKEGQATLRIKTDLRHPNPAFRDRVLFRISDREHPRTKKNFNVWPLLEFSWAIDDHLLGITHIIRGKDLMIESEMEKFIWDIFGWRHPELIHTGMVKMKGIKLSKSKSKHEVQTGKYHGWDDPRTWSLQSLRKRGFRPEAIRNFLLKSGLSKNDVMLPIEDLYHENRILIDKKANRYFFVQDPKLVKIENFKGKNIDIKLHPDFPKRGTRKFKVSNKFYVNKRDFDALKNDKLYRLMDCVNFVKKKNKFIFHSLEHNKFIGKGSRIMHWLPENGNLHASVKMDDGTIVKGLLERNAYKLKLNEICQFERTFFVKLDRKSTNRLDFYYLHS